MQRSTRDLTKHRFGYLQPIERDVTQGRTHWVCLHDSGDIYTIRESRLLDGTCSGLGRRWGVYPKRYPRAYASWLCMRNRCLNPKDKDYPNYTKRHISICSEWGSFIAFIEDMGERPTDLTLDRIDNNKGYSKENCRWLDRLGQCRNISRNRHIIYLGRSLCLVEWSEETGLKRSTIAKRIDKYGWSVEKALTTPVKTRRAR